MGLQSLTASHTFMEIIGSSLQLEACNRWQVATESRELDIAKLRRMNKKDTKSAYSNLE